MNLRSFIRRNWTLARFQKKIETLCKKEMQDHNVTLLYAAKNEKYNHAVVLKEWLEEQIY